VGASEETVSETRPFHRRHWPLLLLAALLVVAAIGGATLGYFMRLDLPDVRALEDYNPPVMSRVLAADGTEVATFAEQRRILIEYGDIPQSFIDALTSIEDSNFYEHTGIDLRGIARAAWSDLRRLRLAQGASTLTQQLARNLFLTPKKTIRRKVQEALLALEIERQYTKEEILRYYCNQIYMGHGRYGLEAAARNYFGKPARDLTLVESATIAGLIQRPEALSPFKNPERSLDRRNHVLSRMVAEGLLDEERATAAAALPIEVAGGRHSENPAPYFVEEVRRWIQQRYGSSSLYQDGFEAQTTLDLELQRYANEAIDAGLRELDRRQGWRGVTRRVPEEADLATWEPESWRHGLVPGGVHDGVVVAVDDDRATVRLGAYAGRLDRKAVAWTKTSSLDALLDPGDVIRVRLVELLDEQTARITLEQEPEAEAALVALDHSTGAVRALVGGFDFERSEFDRAIQARRQTGSAFKPFVFATAFAEGWTLADTVLDEPTVFLDARNPEPYQPENYSNKYYATLTLRRALEKSANIATVKLLDAIGYEAVIDTARRMGIRSQLQPFPSLALGSFEVTLLELTAAYGTFANQGVLVEPHMLSEIRNRQGAPLERIEPAVRDAVTPQTAYLMNSVLSGVITDGTGRAAAALKLPLAGKTGTTDNNTDAWFIGYSPRLTVGVWVGFDEPRSLGSRETGALAALPIWRRFMEAAARGDAELEFPRPPGLRIVSVDRNTGLKANLRAHCDPVISEVFIEGTEPTEYCSVREHDRLRLPYPFQRYALSEQGELVVPAPALQSLLDHETDVYLVDGDQRLEAYLPDGVVSMPLETVSGEPDRPIPQRVLDRYDTSQWSGHDGRMASIVWLR
jgi:penicillin-binding protein 1A